MNHLLHGMILQVLILNPSKCLDPAAPSTLKKTHTYILSVCFKFFNGKFWSSQKKNTQTTTPTSAFCYQVLTPELSEKIAPHFTKSFMASPDFTPFGSKPHPHTLKRFRKSDGSPSVALDWASSPRFKRENREIPRGCGWRRFCKSICLYRLGC